MWRSTFAFLLGMVGHGFPRFLGAVVTAIIVLGCQADTYTSVALGLVVGGMATFFASLAPR